MDAETANRYAKRRAAEQRIGAGIYARMPKPENIVTNQGGRIVESLTLPDGTVYATRTIGIK